MNKRERGKRLMKEELKDRHENIYICVCVRESSYSPKILTTPVKLLCGFGCKKGNTGVALCVERQMFRFTKNYRGKKEKESLI